MANYIIYRDVYTQDETTGTWSKNVGREYLRITKSRRYVWQDKQQAASELRINESCKVMDNLQRVIRTKYNYGKIYLHK